jgi:hypothetical protein
VTQVPSDVPASVLAQLGNRVQHALRAFTPEDADALRKAARTFPTTKFYDVETTITGLGTGEALVTVLSSKGVPTPLAATRLLPPDSLMAPVDAATFQNMTAASPFLAKYGTPIDRDSAYEMLTAKVAAAREAAAAAQDAATRAGLDPTTATGLNGMTPAQQQREIARQQREIEAAQQRAAREAERQQRAEQKAAAASARARQRTIDSAIRTGGRVVTSRVGQDLIRGIFGTLFGGGRRR